MVLEKDNPNSPFDANIAEQACSRWLLGHICAD